MTSIEVDNKYKKHELRTHIYERPAMYIGTIEPTPIDTYIIDNSNKITCKICSFVSYNSLSSYVHNCLCKTKSK